MKCEKCGSKIQYNKYKKVRGKYYCPECAPKNLSGLKDVVSKIITSAEKVEEDYGKHDLSNPVIGKEAMKQKDTECFSKNTGLGGKALKQKRKYKKRK